MPSWSGEVRRTVSLTLGVVAPYGSDELVYDGNGSTVPPRALMSPGFFAAVSLLTSSMPGVTGRKPSGLPAGSAVEWNGKPGRPFSVGPGNGMFPTPKRRSLAPVKSAQPETCSGPGSAPAATCGLM